MSMKMSTKISKSRRSWRVEKGPGEKMSMKMSVDKVSGGPGGFRKVREADRSNFVQILSKSQVVVPSYDPKTTKVND